MNQERPKTLYEADPDKAIEEYLARLGLNAEDLIGKKVLEVGSQFGRFLKLARKKGIDVVGIENDLKIGQISPENTILSDARSLPFKDESFDIALSRFAPPTTFDNREDVVKFIQEILRVLKPQGRFYFSRPPRVYFDHKELPTDADPLKKQKDREAISSMERDIKIPIRAMDVVSQNMIIGRSGYNDMAHVIEKR